MDISTDLAKRILALAPADQARLEQRVRERQGRRWLGGRDLGALMEEQLFARDTPGWHYYRALMRLDRRAA